MAELENGLGMDMNLDITTDVSSQREPNLEPGITPCVMVSVEKKEFEIKKGERKGNKSLGVVVRFRQLSDNTRYYNHNILPLEMPNADSTPKQIEKFEGGKKTLISNLKHFVEAYTPFNEEVSNKYFKGIKSIEHLLDRFYRCMNGFAAEGELGEANPVFFKEKQPIPVYLKITYTKISGAYLSLPYQYPFLEKVRYSGTNPVKTTLSINPDFDFLEPVKSTATNTSGGSGGTNTAPDDDFPII